MADKQMQHSPYRHLAWMMVLSFAAMYVLMYAMVDALAHVYNNVNQLYMTGLMVGAMLVLEIAFMRSMYPNQRLNVILAIGGILLMVACWLLVRYQAGVADQQFLRSMIPHHASAILMCEKASIEDKQIQALCTQILNGQRKEIAEMQALLAKRAN